ncbi:hypothetical protein PMAYCL1PPCAC_10906, partial [Pristionchus mayeri]
HNNDFGIHMNFAPSHAATHSTCVIATPMYIQALPPALHVTVTIAVFGSAGSKTVPPPAPSPPFTSMLAFCPKHVKVLSKHPAALFVVISPSIILGVSGSCVTLIRLPEQLRQFPAGIPGPPGLVAMQPSAAEIRDERRTR